jgi:hypothetical protein
MLDSDPYPDPDSMNPNPLHWMQQCGYGSRKANLCPEKEKQFVSKVFLLRTGSFF